MECPINELYTIRDYLRWTMSQLQREDVYLGHGTDNAWDEAIALVLPILDCPLSLSADLLDARVTQLEKERLREALLRRCRDKIPTPYITQQAWFAERPFYVDERVLIPRSPLAEVIQADFAPWCDGEQLRRVCDLCTGSGSLAITMALQLPAIEVDAVDIDKQALEVAKRNVVDYGLEDRVNLIESDVFSSLDARRPYDLIVSNPPYVDEATYRALPAEYHHEPEHALWAADQGLAIVDRMIKQARNYLTEEGVLLVEVGEQEALVDARYAHLPLTWLSFSQGGQGVFMLHAADLPIYKEEG